MGSCQARSSPQRLTSSSASRSGGDPKAPAALSRSAGAGIEPSGPKVLAARKSYWVFRTCLVLASVGCVDVHGDGSRGGGPGGSLGRVWPLALLGPRAGGVSVPLATVAGGRNRSCDTSWVEGATRLVSPPEVNARLGGSAQCFSATRIPSMRVVTPAMVGSVSCPGSRDDTW